jgi:glutamate carboxypeptidase
MHPFLAYAKQHERDIIELIRRSAECESPSDQPAAVNRFVDLLIEETRDIAKARTVKTGNFGKQLKLEFLIGPRRKEGRILGLGHSDTVWSLGTLRSMPFRESRGRLWGPGVLDMKAGLAFFIFAVRTLRDLDVPVRRAVSMLIVSDEETGSHASRSLTETEAKSSDFVLVLEPGTGLTGKLKTSRKGIGNYSINVRGRSAHAGVDFSDGASAIVEAARIVGQIATFTDVARGITVNPGVISGGTRSNVVAAEARLEVDVRVPKTRDFKVVDRKLRALRPGDRRCSIEVEGGLNRPPMERTPAIANMFAKAKAIAGQYRLELEESATGGGSDGNFTAALGIPTLDGLGAVGEGAHADNESILINRIADRTALMAGLLAEL